MARPPNFKGSRGRMSQVRALAQTLPYGHLSNKAWAVELQEAAKLRGEWEGDFETACKKTMCFWMAERGTYVNQVLDDPSFISQGTLCFACDKVFLCSLHLTESILGNSMIS